LELKANNLGSMRNVPEPGQLVEVRRRKWVVSNVQGSSLSTGFNGEQHLATLSSLDEDALGEEIRVIWQIEPGAHIIERAGLPSVTGIDDSDRLEAFLDAVRWGAATNADRNFLQSPFRSGVKIETFQLDPLVRAIDMARVNLLIADDVGLGKTIEAGLVIQELLLRHRARSVFIVCPASLQEKWRVEMLEKFGLDFKIVDTSYIKQLRRERGIHVNPWTSFPRLITSMDWIKSGEALRLMRDILPIHKGTQRKFDILVVDEAHNVAPVGSSNYVLESQRTRLIRTISPHFQHRLFLTATPHNGYTKSFAALLELLDAQRFSRGMTEIDEKQLGQIMVRRLKMDLKDEDGNPIFPIRVLKPLSIDYTAEERLIHKKLNEYCTSREKTCDSNDMGTKFVNNLLKKRLFSSPASFAATLEKHYSTVTAGKKEDRSPIAERILKKAILKAEEDYADDSQFESAQMEAIEEATKRSTPLSEIESRLLNELRTWAQKAMHKTDSKARAIISWLESNLKTNEKWNGNRVILFTEYRTTHKWLHEILASNDFGGERLAILHGGIDNEEREKIKASFQANSEDSSVRILLATDAASEGIDLQNHCNLLIHLEIPYNPNVMEQRNGRIDRHGQKQKEVHIWHPVDGGKSSDAPVGGHKDDIIRALKKLEAMREDMGSVNPVIAPQMSGLIEGTRREFDTHRAEAMAAKAKKYLRIEKQFEERISKLKHKLDETQKDFHLTPEHIQRTVMTGLALADMPPLKPIELKNAPEGSVFEMPLMPGAWARCLEGLEHPHTHKIRPITFDHEVAAGRDDIVLVHMNHRLVQMCLRLLRAEVWARDDVKKLHRINVKSLPNGHIEDFGVVLISRLVITGGNHHRLHEELTVCGGYLKANNFSRESRVTEINDWLDDSRPFSPRPDLFETLKDRFEKYSSSIQQTIDTRSKDRLKHLVNTIGSLKNQETKNISSILDELEKSIREELKKEEKPVQLKLWAEDERTQLKRDISALKARLFQIPQEKDREIEAIEKRYSNLTDRTFPVAAIFLVPDTSKGGVR
jgi:superfamily II DNA or RNA helicase